MSNHTGSAREGAMKWTKLWDGTRPASVFMLKWLVFVDLPRTRPRQIDLLGEPEQEEAKAPLPYFKKTSSSVLIWKQSLPRALCTPPPRHALQVLSSADLCLGAGRFIACLAYTFQQSAVGEQEKLMQDVIRLATQMHSGCFVNRWLHTHTHTHMHTHTQIISLSFHNPRRKTACQ